MEITRFKTLAEVSKSVVMKLYNKGEKAPYQSRKFENKLSVKIVRFFFAVFLPFQNKSKGEIPKLRLG